MNFRDLYADEIECRVAQISLNSDKKSAKGLSLLLYKDARVDQNILDETVTPMNWQRDHKELKGNIYCGISIWDDKKQMWVTKWDCGKESNTEAEKGEASDSFKRAGFNWGIGRELYTAPFIWINASDTDIRQTPNGKFQCYDNFHVKSITIKDKKIVGLTIAKKNGEVVYTMGKTESKPKAEAPKVADPLNENRLLPVVNELKRIGYGTKAICSKYNVDDITKLTDEQIQDFLSKAKDLPTKE